MHTMETDRLVDDYLRRLERAAAHMQRARRTELVAEIRGHIDMALRQEQAAGEAAVRNVLDRLGPPEDIVAPLNRSPTRRPKRRQAGDRCADRLDRAGHRLADRRRPGLRLRVWSRRDKLVAAVLLLLPIVVLS